jgi:hypothetical protein
MPGGNPSHEALLDEIRTLPVTSTSAGATLRELMDRMGHDSERAAMIYLHGSDARQHEIADSLSKLAREVLKRGSKGTGRQPSGKRSGTQRARNRGQAS